MACCNGLTKDTYFFRRAAVSVIVCIALVFTQLAPVAYADESGVPFAGFNQQNINLTATNWSTSDQATVGSAITMAGSDSHAVYYINLTGIANSVDCGTLKIDFSVLATIGNEAAVDLDSASATITFRETEGGAPLDSYTVSRGTASPGTGLSLASDATVPVRTRFIFIDLRGVKAGSTNTVSFSSPSLYIRDAQDPTLTVSRSTDWTNQDVTVTLTAADTQSGVQGIYDASNSHSVSSTAQYQYNVSSNSSASFYTMDWAGRTSEAVNVVVSNIDKNGPAAAPEIGLSKTGWSAEPVTLTLSDTAPAGGESPETRQYRLNGGEWTPYTEPVTLNTSGEINIETRVVDGAGNSSGIKSATAYVDLISPAIDTLSPEVYSSGGATITFAASDAGGSGLAEKRWAAGSQNVAYFAIGGTVLPGDTFDVATGGVYTVYAKDNAGNTTLTTINVDTYPTISTIQDQNVDEDQQKTVNFTVSDSETEAGSLAVSAVSSDTGVLPDPQVTNENGSVSLVLAPAENRNGTATVTVTVRDGSGNSTQAQFVVTVNDINDVPVAANDEALTQEDTPVSIDVLANDTDSDGDTLTISAAGGASHGTVTIAGDKRSLTYTPAANYNGTDSFTYTATDGDAASQPATVSVTIEEENDPPHAVDDSVTLQEDNDILIDVLANDTDLDKDTTADEVLTIQSVSAPDHGTAVLQDNKILYSAPSDWSGTDSFTYTIQDRKGVASQATVRVTVQPVNDAPKFSGDLKDAYTVLEDSGEHTVTFDISDVETDQDSLMLQAASGDETKIRNSSIVIGGLGDLDSEATLAFTPVANANGDVDLYLKLSDGFIVTEKTVTIHITPVNDAPQANPDTYQYFEDTSLVIDMDELTDNDTDIEDDPLTFAGIASQPLHGTLVLQSGNSYRYEPEANYSGDVTFTYTVSDGTDTATGLVTLKGTAVNDAPTITLDSNNVYETDEDETISGLKFHISDLETAENDLIVTAGSSNPDIVSADHITVNKGSDGACTLSIQPNADRNGEATITLTVSDGNLMNSAGFLLKIIAKPDNPIAQDDYISVAQSGTAVFQPMANDNDVDGDTLTIVSYTQPAKGTVTRNGDTLSYQDTSGAAGADQFTYTVSDGALQATATVYISIGGFSFPPKISGVPSQFLNEDQSTSVLPFTIFDPDAGETLTLTASSDNEGLVPNEPANIVLVKGADGNCSVQIVPLAGKSGIANITLTVEDPAYNQAKSKFTVTVYPVNSPPVAVNDAFVVNEDTTSILDMLNNDSDDETAHDQLKIVSVHTPDDFHGRLNLVDGEYQYTPHLNYYGSDSFTYTMTDGETTAQASVTITVNPVNDAPRAYNIWRELPNSAGTETVTFGISGYDLEGDTLYPHSVGAPRNGTAVINGDGTITYTRTKISAEDNGADSFTYTIRDRETATGDVLYATATVYIGVDFGSNVWSEDVWAYEDEDAEAFWIPLSFSFPGGHTISVSTGASTLGSITQTDAAGKRVQFTPNANANGEETISYTVTDETAGKISTSNIHLTIYPVNDRPVFTIVPDDQTAQEDHATGELDVQFSDPDSTGLLFNVFVVNDDESKPVLLKEGVTVTRADENNAKIQLAPVANANGTATVTLQASDGMLSAEETFTFTVTPVNDAPTAEDLSVIMQEDTSQTITVLGPNSDVDGDTLIVTAGSASDGAAVVNPDGTITYTPKADFFGVDAFTYTLDDGHGGTATATVTITVQNVNDLPVIGGLNSKYQTDEDIALAVPFTIFDADGDVLTLTIASGNTTLFPEGSLVLTGTGGNRTLTATPAANLFGSALITLTLNDGHTPGTTTQKFTITVNSVNDVPTVVGDSYTIAEDTPTQFNVLSNDSDVDNAVFNIVAVGKPANGTAVNNGGSILYTPKANYYGTDTFTYTVADSDNGQATATVNVTITPVNDPPNAASDSATTAEDTPVTISVLSNDSDVEGNTLQVLSASGGSLSQSITVNPDGTVTYTPALNKNGTDTFTYTVSDGQPENNQSTGTVTVKITPVNDAPKVENDPSNPPGEWTMKEDETGIFKFDVSDPETDVKNLIVTMYSSNQTIIKDTSITFTGSGIVKTASLVPELNQSGDLTIYVNASDGDKTTVAIFNLHVIPVNDTPEIHAQNLTTNEDTPVSGRATGSDVESTALTFAQGTNPGEGPSHGSVEVQSNGDYTYTPAANYNGTDSFVVTVDDGSGADNSVSRKTVTVTVNPANDAPTAAPDSDSTSEDTSVIIPVLANDFDVDTDPDLNAHPGSESISLVSGSITAPTHGTAAEESGQIRYTPASNWNGTDTFNYTIRDTAGLTSTATVTVVVNPVNDDPANGDDLYTVVEDTPKVLDVLDNDDVDIKTNPSTEELTITGIQSGPSHGTADYSGGKNITYTPASNYYGTDSFVYNMQDKAGKTGEFTVNITVTPVNDQPTITPKPMPDQTVEEDVATGALSFTVADVEDEVAKLAVTASSSNQTLVPNSNLAVTKNSDGTCTITVTPAAHRNTQADGTAVITVQVKDLGNLTNTATFTLTVTAKNNEPDAQADFFETDENTPVLLDVLNNDDVDLNIEGDTLEILSVSHDDPKLGEYSVVTDPADNNRQKISFTPYANWTSKTDQNQVLHYTMKDGSGAESSALATLAVRAVNDDPQIAETIPDQEMDEDAETGTGAIAFTVSDEEDAAADLDVEATSSDTALFTEAGIILSGSGANRTIQLIPAADQNGEATISLTVKDKDGGETTKTFKVLVNPVPDLPEDGDDIFTVVEDTPTTLNVLLNDAEVDTTTNPDITTLTLLSIGTGEAAPKHGDAVIVDNKVLYTPDLNNNEDDSFTYTMRNQSGLQGTFKVDVKITPVNDPPDIIAAIGDKETSEGIAIGPFSFTVSDVDDDLKNLYVEAGSTNQVLIPIDSTHITFTADELNYANRAVSIQPAGKWNGASTITLTVKDDDHAWDAGSVTTFKVVVKEVNDPPVAVADSFTSNEDTAVTLNVLGNDTDADLETNPSTETMTIKEITQPNHAAASIQPGGKQLLFTPKDNWNGTAQFTYTIQDAAGITSTANVQVKVNAKNDAPTVAADTASTNEDTEVTIDALANDSDIDTDTDLNTDPNWNPASETIAIDPGGFANVDGGTVAVVDGKIKYTPKANWNGADEFTYTAVDAAGAKTAGTVTLTVNPVNDAPMAADDAATLNEDSAKTITVLANDSDADLSATNNHPVTDALTVAIQTGPQHGGVVLNANNTVTYTPAANWNGSDEFTYTITDKAGAASSATVRLTVNQVNDAPVAVADSKTIDEDTNILIDVLANDTDTDKNEALNKTPGAESLSIVAGSVTGAQHGTAVIESEQVRYTPTANWNGVETFTYTVRDVTGATSVGTVTVTVNQVNDAPVAAADSATITEGSFATINVLANDSDVDKNAALNATPSAESLHVDPDGFSATAHGSVVVNGDNTITYTPVADWNGTETFTYTVRDAAGASATSQVTVTVTQVNDAPVAAADWGETNEDTAVAIDVLANDTDKDKDPDLNANPSAESLTLDSNGFYGVQNGTAVVEDNKIKFTPAANWNGETSFQYTVRDASNVPATAYVTVMVHAVNDAPVAVADAATVNEDSSVLINALANDTDADQSATLNKDTAANPAGEILALDAGGFAGLQHGTAVVEGGQIRYTPVANWNGTETFTYTVRDPAGAPAAGTVTVTVNQVNDAPVAANDEVTTNEDTQVVINALANDTDLDKDVDLNANPGAEVLSLDALGFGEVSHGTVAADGNQIRYTPEANWNGEVSFTYTVKDKAGAASVATVKVIIKGVNDAPDAVADAVEMDEDTAILIDVLANDKDTDKNETLNNDPDADPDDEAILLTGVSGATNGTAEMEGGKVRFTPKANWNGTEIFSYSVRDVYGDTDTAFITVTVKQVNDTPAPQNDTASADEDSSVIIGVLDNDWDEDLSTANNHPMEEQLSSQVSSAPAHGTAQANADGTITYTPAANWNGTDSFTYAAVDKKGAFKNATVSVTVAQKNDPPAAHDDTASTYESTPVDINVLANDTDIDMDANLNANPSAEVLTILTNGFTGVEHGTAEVVGNKVRFTPEDHWNGTITFGYTIRDKDNAQSSASITLTIGGVNNSPQAVGDTAVTDEDTPVTINALANDTDIDLDAYLNGDPDAEELSLVADGFSNLDHGTAQVQGGKVVFTPQANWNGTEIFTYTMRDLAGARDTADITVTVRAVNDAPNAEDDSAATSVNTSVLIDALANDADVDMDGALNETPGDQISLAAAGISGVDNGTAVIENGKIRFTPASNWKGTEEFTYTVRDTAGLTDTAAVRVSAVNKAPTPPKLLTPKSGDAFKDGQKIPVTWNPATDPDGDPIAYTLSFYDGSVWKDIATGLTATNYNHELKDTGITSDQVRYKVTAQEALGTSSPGGGTTPGDSTDTSRLSTSSVGQTFIIDNQAPQNVQVATTSGSSWNRQDVQFSLSGGRDLLRFKYEYSLDQNSWTQLGESEKATFGSNGNITVYYRAVDALENIYSASVSFKIDKLAPAQPQIKYSTTEPTNKDVGVSLGLAQDPGGSGNASVRLPDGAQVSAGGNVIWYARENGQYSFTIYDNAGNSTVVPVSITNIDKTPPQIGVDNGGYKYSELTNKPVRVSLSFSDAGSGMASQTYTLAETKSGGTAQGYEGGITVGEDGTYYIHAYAKDRAGNLAEAVFGPYVVDTTPPKVAYKIDNLTTQGGDIVLNFSDDATGTVTVTMPDGTVQKVSVENFHFTATQSGVYIIEIVDAAGNITRQTITVTLPETQVPQSALPLPAGLAQTDPCILYGALGVLVLIILLILLWALRPVRVIYVASTKKTLKIKKRFAHAPRKGGLLKINITPKKKYKDLAFITVVFRRGFTKKMKERYVRLVLNGQEVLLESVQKEDGKVWRRSVFL